MGRTPLARPQPRALALAGGLGRGVCAAYVAHHRTALEHPPQTAFHAVSLALAAVPGHSVQFTDHSGSAAMDIAPGNLLDYAVGALFRVAAFAATMVGLRSGPARDAGQHGHRRGL